jgi:hypothetical protein
MTSSNATFHYTASDEAPETMENSHENFSVNSCVCVCVCQLVSLVKMFGLFRLEWIVLVIRISFILCELISLVKMFRLFRLEWIVLVFRESVDTIDKCTTFY